jgi:uncharacterized HAD superfamily protein
MLNPLSSGSKKRLRIGLDIDDVIADFWQIALPTFNKKFGVNARKEDFSKFDAMKWVYKISYAEFVATIISDQIFEQMIPYDGVPEVVQGYREAGAEIILVTSRGFHPHAYQLTKDFLDRHDVPFDKLHIKREGHTKDQYLDGQVDIFVDDLPENLIHIERSGKARRLAMIHQPWNTGDDQFPRFDHLGTVDIV